MNSYAAPLELIERHCYFTINIPPLRGLEEIRNVIFAME
ncbi:hypothetical protein SAMN05444483_1282 [Salegentibacter echinorum]|uniref:Uncharacterized protein n=1 Tax=Salegentibacter echinorum TaxID=1073325 RepID=A0A1M5MEP3_SALEC|nr:hypothetical protein SAMN05444483_1282 [Salegentibacter echinorum]